MVKKILFLQFSQTGQTNAVCDALRKPLQEAGMATEVLSLPPTQSYPFPWPFFQFLDIFPETVAEVSRYDAHTLAELRVTHAEYDLIVLAYPVWFLSPAPPIQAFLQSELAKHIFHNTPVVTLTTCRNMWVQAQMVIKRRLDDLSARLLDHVVVADPSPSFTTFFTTPYWVLTGKKTNQPFGFPDAGLRDEQIADCQRFGKALAFALKKDDELGNKPLLTGLEACSIDPALAASEAIGKRSFKIWSKILRTLGKPGGLLRRIGLAIYVTILIILICTVVPLIMLLRKIAFSCNPKRSAAIRAELELPSGNGNERMKDFV